VRLAPPSTSVRFAQPQSVAELNVSIVASRLLIVASEELSWI
jgi:hypothetical protein